MDCSVLLRKTSIGHWFDSGSGDFFAHRAVLFCAPFPHVIHAVSARAGCRLDGTAQPIKPQRSWQARNADSVSMPAGRWLTSSPRLHALSRAKNGLAWRPRRRRWASSTATDPRPSPGSSRGRGPLSRPPRRSPRGAARLPRSRPATPRPSLGRRAAEADPWPQPRAQPPRRPGSPGPRRSASRRSFPHAPLTAPRQRAPRRGRPAASPVVIPRPRPRVGRESAARRRGRGHGTAAEIIASADKSAWTPVEDVVADEASMGRGNGGDASRGRGYGLIKGDVVSVKKATWTAVGCVVPDEALAGRRGSGGRYNKIPATTTAGRRGGVAPPQTRPRNDRGGYRLSGQIRADSQGECFRVRGRRRRE